MENVFVAADAIFLGTGASDEVPNASCILFGKEPPCPACDSAHNQPNSKDKRRQTSLLLKLYHADGSFKTILIDAGWTLSASVMDLFPKHGISKIDAVFITHEHADAINGLPFLRSWTLHGFQSSIDVYTSSHTFEFLRKSFPYLVARLQGGPATTAFNYHQLDLNNSFTCFDDSLTVNALAVHHGGTSDRPYISTGFDFPTLGLTYISDAHALPDSTWHFIRRRLSATGNQTQVLIVDCLKVTPSRAHFGLGQALGTAKALNAETTYFTQISDGFSHEQLTDVCKTIAACTDPEDQKPFLEAFQRAQQSTRQIKSRIAHRMLGVADDDLDALRGMALTEAITCGSIGVQNAQPAYDGQVLHLKALNLGSP